jgi:hypothetical protein
VGVPPSQVQEGFYYEKENSPGWLRLAIRVWGDVVVYADFVGYGQRTHLGRWAQRRLTPKEAETEFPKEVAKIAQAMAARGAPPPIF